MILFIFTSVVLCLHFLILSKFRIKFSFLAVLLTLITIVILRTLDRQLIDLFLSGGLFSMIVLRPTVFGAIEEVLRASLLFFLYFKIFLPRDSWENHFPQITIPLAVIYSLWECSDDYLSLSMYVFKMSGAAASKLSPENYEAITNLSPLVAILMAASWLIRLFIHILLISLSTRCLINKRYFLFLLIAITHGAMNFLIAYPSKLDTILGSEILDVICQIATLSCLLLIGKVIFGWPQINLMRFTPKVIGNSKRPNN